MTTRGHVVQPEFEANAERPYAMRSVNAEIAVVAADFERRVDEPLRWGFACECGKAECDEWVDLDLAAYAAIRADRAGAILAEGHNLPRPERARRRAAQLRDDARALRAEARLQTSRARHDGRVRRDYRYELRDGERTLATGRLSSAEPIKAGDAVEFAGITGTVETIELVSGDHEPLLIAQLQQPESRTVKPDDAGWSRRSRRAVSAQQADEPRAGSTSKVSRAGCRPNTR